MARTIIIEWKLADGVFFAHFPAPFAMDPAEWNAFSALFDQVGFKPHHNNDIRVIGPAADAPRRLADGLMALGYSLEHRGDVPPAIMTGKSAPLY